MTLIEQIKAGFLSKAPILYPPDQRYPRFSTPNRTKNDRLP